MSRRPYLWLLMCFFFLCFPPLSLAQRHMVKHLYANAIQRKALCNDNTPGNFYFGASSTGSTKWMVWLQGGDQCSSNATCALRYQQQRSLMSSNGTALSITQGGLFSNNATYNPDFYDFNVIFASYCSSDLWTGNFPNSSVGGWSFLGSYHVPALIGDLTDPALFPYPNLANATELLFGGSSAGGLGAFQNANRLKTLTPWIPKIRIAIDAGWAPPYLPYNATVVAIGLGNSSVFPWKPVLDASCAAAHNLNEMDTQTCFYGDNIYPYMQFPTFNHISLTDATLTRDNYGVPPVDAATPADVIEYLLGYANATRSGLVAAKVTAAFSEMCYEHTALGGSVSSVTIFGEGILKALGDFYYDRATVHLVDCCTEFNCNPTCGAEVCPMSAGTCGPYISTCPDILDGSTSSGDPNGSSISSAPTMIGPMTWIVSNLF